MTKEAGTSSTVEIKRKVRPDQIPSDALRIGIIAQSKPRYGSRTMRGVSGGEEALTALPLRPLSMRAAVGKGGDLRLEPDISCENARKPSAFRVRNSSEERHRGSSCISGGAPRLSLQCYGSLLMQSGRCSCCGVTMPDKGSHRRGNPDSPDAGPLRRRHCQTPCVRSLMIVPLRPRTPSLHRSRSRRCPRGLPVAAYRPSPSICRSGALIRRDGAWIDIAFSILAYSISGGDPVALPAWL